MSARCLASKRRWRKPTGWQFGACSKLKSGFSKDAGIGIKQSLPEFKSHAISAASKIMDSHPLIVGTIPPWLSQSSRAPHFVIPVETGIHISIINCTRDDIPRVSPGHPTPLISSFSWKRESIFQSNRTRTDIPRIDALTPSRNPDPLDPNRCLAANRQRCSRLLVSLARTVQRKPTPPRSHDRHKGYTSPSLKM